MGVILAQLFAQMLEERLYTQLGEGAAPRAQDWGLRLLRTGNFYVGVFISFLNEATEFFSFFIFKYGTIEQEQKIPLAILVLNKFLNFPSQTFKMLKFSSLIQIS